MGTYIRLIDHGPDEKEKNFFNEDNMYFTATTDYEIIEGNPFAYWLGENIKKMFSEETMEKHAEPRMGLTTGNNEKYLRLWHEVLFSNIGFGCDRFEAQTSQKRWFPYDKAGEFRKWYGNLDYVVDWYDDGKEMQTTLHPSGTRIWAHNFNLEYNFKAHISWNDIVTKHISFRAFNKGFMFDSAAATIFVDGNDFYYLLGYLNSCVVDYLASVLNPTLHFKLGDFQKLPYPQKVDMDEVSKLANECVEITEEEWDDFEISWDFKSHPLL